MDKKITGFAALGIGSGIALGAFGAHGLRSLTNDASILQAYQTGVDYHLFHALAFLVLGLFFSSFNQRPFAKTAFRILIVGVCIFSGSLYTLTLLRLNGWESKWVGPITPIGGACLIVGWTWFAYSLLRSERSN